MLTDPETDRLATIRSEFDQHRATHRRGRFPERLWQQAVGFARELGIEWVAFDLDLDEYGIPRRMMTSFDVEPAVPEQPVFLHA